MSRNSGRWDFRAFVLRKWIENPNVKKSELPRLFRAEGGRIRDSYARRIYREVFADLERYGKGRAREVVDRRRVAFEVFARERLKEDPKLSARKLRTEFRRLGLSISNDSANEIVRQLKEVGKAYHKITRLRYTPMSLFGRRFRTKYAYLISYAYRMKNGYLWERGVITVLSDEYLTPQQVIEKAKELFEEDVYGHYEPLVIDLDSLVIEQALFDDFR